jgi:hypothetical protein
LTKPEVESLTHKVANLYRVNMLLDNLPITVYDLLDEVRCWALLSVGCVWVCVGGCVCVLACVFIGGGHDGRGW